MNNNPLNIIDNSQFNDYKKTFVQRLPRYAIKQINGKRWSTKNKPLCDKPVLSHLDGKYYVGTLGRWYPEFAILDFDDVSNEFVSNIRDELSLNETNSMLFSSESRNSFHLLLKPEYNSNPPTLRLLRNAFKTFALQHGIEVYPQKNRIIRLPFGANQNPLDLNYFSLENWQDYLYWFQKLDSFDLSMVKSQQLSLDLKTVPSSNVPNIIEEAKYLFENGLQSPSSRHYSQFVILYYLFRSNVPQEQAEQIIWKWIQNKHNGFSKDILRYPQHVQKEIQRQVSHIYNKYELSNVYPDSTHNTHYGYITKPDIEEIIIICNANLPKVRFTYNLVRYCYPRRYRTFLNVHTDRLIEWSNERTYLKYLNELEEKGIIKRGNVYLSDVFSKDLKLNWNFKSDNEAILYNGRAINTLEDTIKLMYKPQEIREILIKAGADKGNVSKYLKGIYGVVKMQNINN